MAGTYLISFPFWRDPPSTWLCFRRRTSSGAAPPRDLSPDGKEFLATERLLLALDGETWRSKVVAGEWNGYRILHFATHGFINPRISKLSGLMLSLVNADGESLDGFLGLHDVANLDLSAELVLSGCQTALGKAMSGEGWEGLPRGFLYTGVPRVVASLW